MDRVTWNEVECGDYTADMALWEELADGTDKPIMELGCGAGRVTMHLARRGASLVIGVDHDASLVARVWEQAEPRISGDAEIGDVRDFEFATKFGLVLAPMQLIQLLADDQERRACLSCVAAHLLPGGLAAFAIVEQLPAIPSGEVAPPLPDVRQVEGWIYSSLPLEPLTDGASIRLRRLRQTVDPDGNMSEEMNEVSLATLSADTLEAEGAVTGLRPLARREIPATEAHVGSTVVLFEKDA
jgi:SAM-dependent methyltransferase